MVEISGKAVTSGKTNPWILGHPDFQLFFSFHVFRDFFYAVFCADSENVLKNVIRLNSGKLWGGFDPPLFQNLVNILNSVFSFKVMMLRVILFERALNSVQFKKKFVWIDPIS